MIRFMISFAIVAAVVLFTGCGDDHGCGKGSGSCIVIPDPCELDPWCAPGTGGTGGRGGTGGVAGIGGSGGYSGTGGLGGGGGIGGVGGLGGFGGGGIGGAGGFAGQGGTAGFGGFGGSGTAGSGGAGGSDVPCTCWRDCIDYDKCTWDYCYRGECNYYNWCEDKPGHGHYKD